MTQARESNQLWTFASDAPARILFADDDRVLAEFAKVHLCTSTISLEYAPDGHAAWNFLVNGRFDLALIDIDVPDLNGLSLVQKIRGDQRLCHLPTVVITPPEDVVSIERAFEAGATSFVAKPVNWPLLSHQLRYVLRASRLEADSRAERDKARQELTVKDSILGIIRREFRTPLNSIIGFTRMMIQETHGPMTVPDYRQFVDHVYKSACRLLEGVVDALGYAQLTSERFELAQDEYRLRKIVDAAIEAAHSTTDKRAIAVDLQESLEQSYIVCDREHLVRSLGHLLENAMTHGEAAGVKLAVMRSPAGELVFAVSDLGPGINLDRLSVAEPFQACASLTRPLEGLGLGLPLARRVAELHGGRLEVDARPGSGTLVRIALPPSRRRDGGGRRDDATTETRAPAPGPAGGPRGASAA